MVKWRYYRAPSGNLLSPFLPYESGDLFLRQVLAMQKEGKTPIAYDDAQWLFGGASEDFITANTSGLDVWKKNRKLMQEEIKKCQDFIGNMVQWLSDQGYYINLTGDEYQTEYEAGRPLRKSRH